MPRPTLPTKTRLGSALRSKRGESDMRETAKQIGITQATLSRLERGAHRPTYDTAKVLAAWLGWTVEAVMEGAGEEEK